MSEQTNYPEISDGWRRDVSQVTDCLPGNIEAQIEAKRAGRRKLVRHGGLLCSRCLTNPPKGKDRYCGECRRTYKRDHERAERDELKRLRAIVEGEKHGEGDAQA